MANRIRTFAELTTADERTRRFTSLGFSTGGMLAPEASADYQQRLIADAELAEDVPERTRASFERIRLVHSYGVLAYDFFTLADDLTWITLEMALRERFIAFYGGQVPIVDTAGRTSRLEASDFSTVANAFRPAGTHHRKW